MTEYSISLWLSNDKNVDQWNVETILQEHFVRGRYWVFYWYPSTNLAKLDSWTALMELITSFMTCYKDNWDFYFIRIVDTFAVFLSSHVSGHRRPQMEGNYCSLQVPNFHYKCIICLTKILSLVALSFWAGLLFSERRTIHYSSWYLHNLIMVLFLYNFEFSWCGW